MVQDMAVYHGIRHRICNMIRNVFEDVYVSWNLITFDCLIGIWFHLGQWWGGCVGNIAMEKVASLEGSVESCDTKSPVRYVMKLWRYHLKLKQKQEVW